MSVSIGRILGIPIRIHYSLWLVFLLITWSLAVGYMPQQYPGLSKDTYWEIGASSALILFISVLVHELSHSYIAKRNKLPIARITLFFFGGVSEITEEPHSPGVEVRMAAAGPLMSFLIGFVLGGLWYLGGVLHFPVPAIAVLQYSAEINLILGAFNLVPAFPLDGGRVFRGGLWSRTRNLLGATRTATRVSDGIAFLMMIIGFFVLILGDLFDGIWLFFLGWFIRSGAETSLRRTMLSEGLVGVSASELMTKDVLSVPPSISIQQLIADYFLIHSHNSYPVVDNGVVVGLITFDGVRSIPREQHPTVMVRDVLIPLERVLTIPPSMHASEIMERMAKAGTDSALVMENGSLLGLVTSNDLMRTLRMRQQLTA